MSNILVTGAGGYIGSHAVKKLLKEGNKVIAFDNFSRGYREPLESLSKYGELIVLEGDLCVKEDLENVFEQEKIDAVMHFAALCSVDESTRKPELYSKNNVLGTLNLLEAMKEGNVSKLIFSSTCAVYGNAEYLPIDEKHRTLPQNPYGKSKLMAEEKIEQFSKIYNLKYIIFRYFNVTGADDEGEIGDSKRPSQLLVQNAVRGALGIEPFALTCPKVGTRDGTPIRDYLDVLDLVDAHMRALEYLGGGGESTILNLGNGKGWSVKEIIEAVKDELGSDFEIIPSSELRMGEYEEEYASIGRAKEILNWQPRRTLKDSIQSLKRWYESKPQGYVK